MKRPKNYRLVDDKKIDEIVALYNNYVLLSNANDYSEQDFDWGFEHHQVRTIYRGVRQVQFYLVKEEHSVPGPTTKGMIDYKSWWTPYYIFHTKGWTECEQNSMMKRRITRDNIKYVSVEFLGGLGCDYEKLEGEQQ